ncbi:DNA-binding protein [Proteus sp. GOKU]|jgi:probable addiction module antidote protein|uniref:helix-turn-helix domain-containing transcriptional regulator n=1 Tax=Proteus TaxID=583 RepID=UPI0013E1730A|nr:MULTISPECIES: helix-turn-helix domain-containing protein [Proteus]QIG05335.1 DNA-binding protein [Proteus sp. ZN5]QPB80404.1 DNA-binding protein [Proteus sp. GOKU]QQP26411.1 DNA-binding protein [Proteus vulgaris]WPC98189.1 DNA-binding protein [Proteus terrae]
MTNKIEKMKQNNIPACIDHDAELIKELREDPVYAEIYLQTALEGIYEPGGVGAFLIALRQIIEAHGGVGEIAKKSGLSRQHIYRALSENGNPTLTTLTEITRAVGVRLASSHCI